MASILDALTKVKARRPQSTQEGLEAAARMKSGKAIAAEGPKASNIAESAAIGTGTSQLREQALKGQETALALGAQRDLQQEGLSLQERQLQSQTDEARKGMATEAALTREGIAGQEALAGEQMSREEKRRSEEMLRKSDEMTKNLMSEYNTSYDNLIQKYSQESRNLSEAERQAGLEKILFTLQLGDRESMNQLSQIGRELQLNDAASYATEILNMQMGNDYTLLMKDLGFNAQMAAQGRNLDQQLMEIKTNFQQGLADQATRDAILNSFISGAFTVGAGIADSWPGTTGTNSGQITSTGQTGLGTGGSNVVAR